MGRRRGAMTPEERSAFDAIGARWHGPEAREAEREARERVREEIPPARARPDLAGALAALRAERERLGLSLADVASRSGLDRSFISRLENGHIPNPTLGTVGRYAAALGKRLGVVLEDAEAVSP